MEENLSKWQPLVKQQIWARCSLEMLLASTFAFLQFSTDFCYCHSAQSVKAVVPPPVWPGSHYDLLPLFLHPPPGSFQSQISQLAGTRQTKDSGLQEEWLFRGHGSANGRQEPDENQTGTAHSSIFLVDCSEGYHIASRSSWQSVSSKHHAMAFSFLPDIFTLPFPLLSISFQIEQMQPSLYSVFSSWNNTK